ncbi:hypothetical protein EJB05_22788, partial [Eragrostis curvula]
MTGYFPASCPSFLYPSPDQTPPAADQSRFFFTFYGTVSPPGVNLGCPGPILPSGGIPTCDGLLQPSAIVLPGCLLLQEQLFLLYLVTPWSNQRDTKLVYPLNDRAPKVDHMDEAAANCEGSDVPDDEEIALPDEVAELQRVGALVDTTTEAHALSEDEEFCCDDLEELNSESSDDSDSGWKRWPKGLIPPDCRKPRNMGTIEMAMRNSRKRSTRYIFEPVLGMGFDAKEIERLVEWRSKQLGFKSVQEQLDCNGISSASDCEGVVVLGERVVASHRAGVSGAVERWEGGVNESYGRLQEHAAFQDGVMPGKRMNPGRNPI